jgi:putative transposase
MIDWDHKEISIKRQAKLLEVRRTSLYYKLVGISDEELELMRAIDRIYTKWPAFGYRRITAMLREEGYQVNQTVSVSGGSCAKWGLAPSILVQT